MVFEAISNTRKECFIRFPNTLQVGEQGWRSGESNVARVRFPDSASCVG